MIKFILLFLISFLIIYTYLFLYIKFDNKDNKTIEYFIGEDIKLANDFNWLEYKNIKYKKLNSYIYYNNFDLYLNYKHPFYKINDIKYKNIKLNNHNIPKIIWQTLDKEPEKDSELGKLTEKFKKQKGWKYKFIDDDQGEEFIKKNFDKEVLCAFKILIPGAFKADLLRACLLYIHGGVYADIKLKLIYPLDYILDNDLVLVKEINRVYKINTSWGIWNGFLASIPKQKYFKNIIDNIVNNVKNMYYNKQGLSITGPILYGKIYKKTFTNEDNITLLNAYDLNQYDNKYYMSKKNNFEMLISWQKNRNYVKNKEKDYPQLCEEKKIYDLKLHKKYFNNTI